MTLDVDEFDDRQLRLLDVLTRAFEDELPLDRASGAALYQRLRRHLAADGATEADFELLTGQLVRLVIESDNPFTSRQKALQLPLISDVFALRNFHLLIDRGTVVQVDFVDLPTTH
jgi:hypothetical protein